MLRRQLILSLLLAMALLTSTLFAQEPTRQGKNQQIAPATAFSSITAGPGGQLARRSAATGVTPSAAGFTNIYEDKYGKIGIGTPTPTSLLTVQGMIETTLGGYKFPDGSIQTTAALSALTHDATLTGKGTAASPIGISVPFTLSGSAPPFTGVFSVTNTGLGRAISGTSMSGNAVFGESTTSNGILGTSISGNGVAGTSSAAKGVSGESETGSGVGGFSETGAGVLGSTLGSDPAQAAIVGMATNGAKAGLFMGNVQVTGMLAKGGGSFKIDHPLDPENKYLYHSFVESPDMMNIYNGNVTTDANGDALIEMPEYFEALNRDFRYQLTVIGQFAQAMVADEIKGNRFAIKTNAPNVKVSWQVTGIRHDAFANQNRIAVEEPKPEAERGTYLHPQAFDQPEEKSLVWKQQPELRQRIQASRSKQAQAPQAPAPANN